jgi:uncharacterized protein (DUF58 family)
MRVILILVVTIGFYWAVRYVFVENCFKKLSAEINFDNSSIFQGETLKLTISVSNKKLIPLWWLVVKYNISRNLIFNDTTDNGLGNDNYCADTFFVMSYERVTKEYTLLASKRGYYSIKELELNSGDFFGDTRLIKKLNNCTELYVYPRPIDTDTMNIVFKKIYGEIIAKRNFLEDPFQLRGIREYSPFDSMKSVNWKATARSGELKVNQFDSTCCGGVTILLNVEKFNNFDKIEILEKAVSLAASFATEFIKVGLEVELISNGRNEVLGEAVRVKGGSSFENNIEIYEALAALNTNLMEKSLIDLINEEILPWRKNKVIILISHYKNIGVMEAFRTKLLQGYTLKWIVPEGENLDIDFGKLEEFVVGM